MSQVPPPVILCVDDDAMTRQLLKSLLAKHGFAVHLAQDGPSALDMARSLQPDLILLDIQMPGMTGYEVCANLQADSKTTGIPVVFATVDATEQSRARAFSLGAVDYLVKPFSEGPLCAKVRNHLPTRNTWSRITGQAPKPPGEAQGLPPAFAKEQHWSRKVTKTGLLDFKRLLVRKAALTGDRESQLMQCRAADLLSTTSRLGVPSATVASTMAEYLGLPYQVQLDSQDVRLGVLPAEFCRQSELLPIGEREKVHRIAVANPFRIEAIDALRQLEMADPALQLVVADAEKIAVMAGFSMPVHAAGPAVTVSDVAEELRLQQAAEATVAVAIPAEAAEDSEPIIRLVNMLVEKAREVQASDIHLEPGPDEFAVRYRIDGILRVAHRLRPASLSRPIIGRLKIMAGLDIAERRLPQDGRIVLRDFSRNAANMDLRLAIAPSIFGEKAVMRLIDNEKTLMPLENLGFSQRNLINYREKLQAPYGLILHVGPTGSGKSMTLYAALNELRSPEINIQTAEDPVEYTLPGISQLQIHAAIGLTFQRAMRSFLRMDPDVILVGEMRDLETAKMGVEAALTGHLVLSTLHTNDASSTITRFLEMGIEPFMVGSSLVMVCAQRLLRRLCKNCRESFLPDRREEELLGYSPGKGMRAFRPKGCAACGSLGYRGRVGVHELLIPDNDLRHEVCKPGVTAEVLKRQAVDRLGMTTLYWDAVDKVRQGLCGLDDVLANVAQDEFDAEPAWMK